MAHGLHSVLEQGLDKIPVLRDTVTLLRVWARQQGLDAESDGFGGFLLTALAVHLANKGTLVVTPGPLPLHPPWPQIYL
jgi:hypothetical protein